MKRQIYRQEALARLSSPEQLDQLMTITDARGWVALAAVGLLLLVGVVWSIFGSIETTVEGSGLLMRYGGFDWVQAPAAGKVEKILVQDGQQVKQGDVLLHLQISADSGDDVQTQKIVSPRSGRVLDVAARIGESVDPGAFLVSVETPKHPLRAVIYVPASDGYKVERGMRVKILPATEKRYNTTYLRGTVMSASKFPATYAQMMVRLQNEEWVRTLLRNGPALEVVIELSEGSSSANLYSGTPCEASVTIDDRRPLAFLVPGFGT